MRKLKLIDRKSKGAILIKNNQAQKNMELKSDDEEPVDLNRVMLEILISVHESMKTKRRLLSNDGNKFTPWT